ncbi:hypothetical protein ABGV42_00960 [Paenibacillus pabuli]|uniref:hypothetical protein n=1 Tax=Paenibacillus pabuli TaxID=1472 RepID=UPI0032425778
MAWKYIKMAINGSLSAAFAVFMWNTNYKFLLGAGIPQDFSFVVSFPVAISFAMVILIMLTLVLPGTSTVDSTRQLQGN